MTLYRLETLSRRMPAQAFSGEGGLHAAGRWNSLGTRVVYASSSVALACLETLAHMRAPRRLAQRWLFTIDIPARFIERLARLPADWDAEPATDHTRKAGDAWVEEQRSVALLVPSALVRVEQNALLNPRHPQFRLDWVKPPVRFSYDPRLS